MRDSVIQGVGMMLKLYYVLAELQTAQTWNFVHIVLTDGDENASKSSLKMPAKLCLLLAKQFLSECSGCPWKE